MQLNQNIAISDSGFIFNPETGDSFTTNPMGLEVIRLLKENFSRESIIDKLAANYQAERITIAKDMEDYLSTLISYQILSDVE